jgi:8-oxo-dGTP pyrophosphatase MutT (NUDIX family)
VAFADLLAWRDWGFPDKRVNNFFAMGALRGSDGGFVVGEMGAHTANAGKIYFAAGTPDPQDVQAGMVDLSGSLRREVEEETGLTANDYTAAPGWLTVLGPRIAHMKLLQARLPATELCERINAFIASDTKPELARAHVVRGPEDLSPAIQPFVAAFMHYVWSSSP